MRTVFILALLIFNVATKAQTHLPYSMIDYTRPGLLGNNNFLNDTTPGKKWFVSRYTGISTSFMFSKAGSATIFSVPVGVQLSRKLNNNLYAYGAISIAPAYVNFNHSSMSAGMNKPGQNNGFMKSNQLNLFSRAEMGLMYVNDAKTFSISGSIGVERSSYPAFVPDQVNTPAPRRVPPKL